MGDTPLPGPSFPTVTPGGLAQRDPAVLQPREGRGTAKPRQQRDAFPASLSSTLLDIPPTHIEI